MKIKLIVVGKTSDKYLKEGELKYEQRLKHYIKFQDIIISDIKNAKNLSQLDLKRREGEQILSKIENNDELILLDDKGNQFSSMEFSEFLPRFSWRALCSSRSILFNR